VLRDIQLLEPGRIHVHVESQDQDLRLEGVELGPGGEPARRPAELDVHLFGSRDLGGRLSAYAGCWYKRDGHDFRVI